MVDNINPPSNISKNVFNIFGEVATEVDMTTNQELTEIYQDLYLPRDKYIFSGWFSIQNDDLSDGELENIGALWENDENVLSFGLGNWPYTKIFTENLYPQELEALSPTSRNQWWKIHTLGSQLSQGNLAWSDDYFKTISIPAPAEGGEMGNPIEVLDNNM